MNGLITFIYYRCLLLHCFLSLNQIFYETVGCYFWSCYCSINSIGNHINLFTHGDSGFINASSDLNFFLIHRVSHLSITSEAAILAGYMSRTAATRSLDEAFKAQRCVRYCLRVSPYRPGLELPGSLEPAPGSLGIRPPGIDSPGLVSSRVDPRGACISAGASLGLCTIRRSRVGSSSCPV